MNTRNKRLRKTVSNSYKKQKIVETKSHFYLGLSKHLWLSILSFLSTQVFFSIIPTLNSFFLSCTRDYKRMIQSLQVNLSVVRDSDQKRILIEPQQACFLMQSAENLEKLKILIRNPQYVPSLTVANPLNTLLSGMPWVSNLIELDIELVESNHVVLANFLNKLTSLSNLRIVLGCQFPIEIHYLFQRFIDSNDHSKSPNNHPFTPIKHLTLIYKKHFQGYNHSYDIFNALDNSVHLQSFHIHFTSSMPFPSSFSPKFQSNQCLKVLKLAPAFIFNSEFSAAFNNFLIKNNTLQDLEISETLMMSFETFVAMIEFNTALRTLYLIPFLPDAGFSVTFTKISQISQVLEKSNLVEFGLHTECFEVENCEMLGIKSDDPEEFYVEMAKKYFWNVSESFVKNKRIRRLSMEIENLSEGFKKRFNVMESEYLEINTGNYFVFSRI